MSALSIFSPAKINLSLAITGRRADGFHELVSVVAPLAWGDTLEAEPAAGFVLACDDPALPTDASNLVLKAAEAFRRATGWGGGARFGLRKRIPIGAGLGGGSSNAAAALRALDRLAGTALPRERLAAIAAEVGSDCALFLHDGPVVMRGRGERVEPLPVGAVARLRSREVWVFKPAFGIATAWAYRRMAERAAAGVPVYVAAAEAERRLADWLAAETAPAEDLLGNNLEAVAFEKFPALPVLLERLRERFGLAGRMSGSGSACFALAGPEGAEAAVADEIRRSWGESAFVVRTGFA